MNKEWLEVFGGATRTNGECIEFTMAKDKKGYGRKQYKKRIWLSHRLSYMLARNVDPKELFVCHKCDNPSCINPDHLFLGTNRDNMDDMLNKGRSQRKRGEEASKAKLTASQIVAIRMDGRLYSEIAKEYGITAGYVSSIKIGAVWKHVKMESVKTGVVKGSRSGTSKLKEDDVIKIKTDSRTHSQIAKDFGVGRTTISAIKRGVIWSHLDA